jgi:hypothetical protein
MYRHNERFCLYSLARHILYITPTNYMQFTVIFRIRRNGRFWSCINQPGRPLHSFVTFVHTADSANESHNQCRRNTEVTFRSENAAIVDLTDAFQEMIYC